MLEDLQQISRYKGSPGLISGAFILLKTLGKRNVLCIIRNGPGVIRGFFILPQKRLKMHILTTHQNALQGP